MSSLYNRIGERIWNLPEDKTLPEDCYFCKGFFFYKRNDKTFAQYKLWQHTGKQEFVKTVPETELWEMFYKATEPYTTN